MCRDSEGQLHHGQIPNLIFHVGQKNICAEQSDLQAENLEVSVRGWQETDGMLKLGNSRSV